MQFIILSNNLGMGFRPGCLCECLPGRTCSAGPCRSTPRWVRDGHACDGVHMTLNIAVKPVDLANPWQMRDVYSVFLSFQPDQEWLEATEDLPGSVGKIFKLIFGWNTNSDKVTTFNARGKDIDAIADVLEQYLRHTQCQGNFGILGEWVDQMIIMAEETCTSQAKIVSQ